MHVVGCSVAWTSGPSGPECTGDVMSVDLDSISLIPALSIEDAGTLLVSIALLLTLVWAFRLAGKAFNTDEVYRDD